MIPVEYNSFRDSPFKDWQEIDIIVSRDCTLRCSYCYLHKHRDEHYDMDAIIARLDAYLSNIENEQIRDTPVQGVVLSFYPEPWVDPERTNTLVLRCLETLKKHPPFDQKFMIMAGTNGVNLHKKIPAFEHLRERLSLNVTIDGIKEQHDMYRVFPDGSPSWEIVKKNILQNQRDYGIYGTKITIGPKTIKFMFDTTVFCFEEMNFNDVNMNVVFEDLWGDNLKEHLQAYEEQLSKIYEYLISTERWKTNYVSVVGTRNIPREQISQAYGMPTDNVQNRIFCGAASMRSIDSDGSLYPCFRMSPYSLDGDQRFKLVDGSENRRALKGISNYDAANTECFTCPLLSACPMCVGGALEESDSIYYRTMHHCEFTKLQYKWALKLFNHLNPATPLESLI